MGDQDNGVAIFTQTVQDAEQGFDFVRGEHAGWFIQDQQARIRKQQFQDFDLLLLADG